MSAEKTVWDFNPKKKTTLKITTSLFGNNNDIGNKRPKSYNKTPKNVPVKYTNSNQEDETRTFGFISL